MKRNLINFLFFFFLAALRAANPPLLPFPQSFTPLHEDYTIGNSLSDFNTLPQWVTLIQVGTLPGVPVNQEEAYRLTVTANKVTIEAVTYKGTYWALQTLRQLTYKSGNQYKVTGCHILDWPAFRIRGFMHDVGRSYISLEELKKEIETLSRYKINVFHWHLTEDQAWRLESKAFPALNHSDNMTRMPGKYYTMAQARELIEHCHKHNVLLIPEFDMPGHSAAFVRALGYDMQSPEGLNTVKQLLSEACQLFADLPYFHIGTDEVEFTNPRFVPEIVNHLRAKGKKVISWTPGWKYNTGEIDMLQMWSSRAKPHPGIPVIDCRLHYINHYDAFADIVALFHSNIAGQQQGSHDFAGSILALWNDRLIESEQDILIQNSFYPAMLTLAERTWRGGGEEYMYTRGSLLTPVGTKEYHDFVDFENRLLYHKEHALQGYPFAYVRQSNVKWRISDAFPNGGDLTHVFPPEEKEDTTFAYQGNIYHSRPATGASIYLRHVWGNTVPSFYENPQPNHTAYAWTYVYSPRKQRVGLWACTQNYGRSEKDLPPPQGKWDYKESRIQINGQWINPPVWTATHSIADNEIALGNENFEVRLPIPVELEKGWNKVLLKLPVGQFTTPQVRLVKWMFTFVFVTPDGKKEVDGLIYSPEKQHSSRSTFYHQRATLFDLLPVSSQDIVFLGNSITNGGEWHELFNDNRIKNRGISGDTSDGVYDRLNTIITGKPRKIFLMIGINDIARNVPVNIIRGNLERIILKIKEETPKTTLYLQSVLPVNPDFGMFSGHMKPDSIQYLNTQIEELSRKYSVTYIDLYSHFVESDTQKLSPEFTNDGLHLLGAGYLHWAKLIQTYIKEEKKMHTTIDKLPDYPIPGGISAPFAGVHQNRLIIAGGCNFPDIPAADGGKKKFYDNIYYLDTSADKENPLWVKGGGFPHEVAYGASVSTPDGLICIGGQTSESPTGDVFRLRFNTSLGKIETERLPSLPVAVFNADATLLGNTIYLAGGVSSDGLVNSLYSLNLDNLSAGWKTISTNLESQRQQPVVFSHGKELFIAGGYDEHNALVFSDVLLFDFSVNKWCKHADIRLDGQPMALIGAGSAVTDSGLVLCVGGVNYNRFLAALQRIKRTREATSSNNLALLESLKQEGKVYMNQPVEWYLFNPSLLAFDTKTNKWESLGNFQELARAGAGIVWNGKELLIVGGEIKPGVRTVTGSRLITLIPSW